MVLKLAEPCPLSCPSASPAGCRLCLGGPRGRSTGFGPSSGEFGGERLMQVGCLQTGAR